MKLSLPTEFCINKEALWLPGSQDKRFPWPLCLAHSFITDCLSPLWDLTIGRAGSWCLGACAGDRTIGMLGIGGWLPSACSKGKAQQFLMWWNSVWIMNSLYYICCQNHRVSQLKNEPQCLQFWSFKTESFLNIPGQPWTPFVASVDIELMILLPLPPKLCGFQEYATLL